MTLREKQTKFWFMVAQLILKAATFKTPVTIICWTRTEQEQRQMVARGASKTMKSAHLLGLAVDIAFIEDLKHDGVINWPSEKYLPLGEFWELLGGTWGGRFGEEAGRGNGWDSGHFEYREIQQ